MNPFANLSQRSANAAKAIKELNNMSVDKVDRCSKLVSDAGATMDEVVSSIRDVSRFMGQVLSASQGLVPCYHMQCFPEQI